MGRGEDVGVVEAWVCRTVGGVGEQEWGEKAKKGEKKEQQPCEIGGMLVKHLCAGKNEK